jgi:hypothetical protein
MMSQKDFLRRLLEEHNACVEISRRKNADYAGDGDAFKNFRGSEMIGVDPAQAILVRMTDKITRCSNLLRRPAQVKDESIADTLRDLSNYALILLLLIEQQRAERGAKPAKSPRGDEWRKVL